MAKAKKITPKTDTLKQDGAKPPVSAKSKLELISTPIEVNPAGASELVMPPSSIADIAEIAISSIDPPDEETVAIYVANMDILLAGADGVNRALPVIVSNGSAVSEILLRQYGALDRLLKNQEDMRLPILTQVKNITVRQYNQVGGEKGVVEKYTPKHEE